MQRHAGMVASIGVLAGLAAGMVTTGTAVASDETLKAGIEQVVPQIRPTLTTFRSEAKKAESTGDITKLREATRGVRDGITLYKWSVVNRKASTPGGLAAKKQLLVAIREYDIGFAAYDSALRKAAGGASKASTITSLRSFAKRIDEAVKDEATALRALGIS